MDSALKKIQLRPHEEVRAVVRRHIASHIREWFFVALVAVVTLFFMYPLLAQGPLGAGIFIALLVLVTVYGGRVVLVWFYTVAVITTDRVIDIDQRGFFTKIVSEAPLDKIQDVSYGTRGVWQTLWGMGSVTIKTLYNAVTIAITSVKDPERISALVQELVREHTGKQVAVHREQRLTTSQKKQVFSDVLAHEELEAVSDFDLDELLDEYIEVFGEDKLKKVLVDALDAHDDNES